MWPDGCIQVYVAGVAKSRKPGEPIPPSGYGVVVVEKRTRVFLISGPVTAAEPGVTTATDYLASLVAVTRALEWAAVDGVYAGRPIILRFSEPYGPNVASDVWRGKTHKAMAARAKRAWTRLKKRQTPVWLAHLSSKNFNAFASGASALAKAGQRGHRTFGPPVQDVD